MGWIRRHPSRWFCQTASDEASWRLQGQRGAVAVRVRAPSALAGVAIWALGGEDPENWSALDQAFSNK